MCVSSHAWLWIQQYFPVGTSEMTVGIFILWILLKVYEYMRELLNAHFLSGGATRPYQLPYECMY